MLKAEYSRFIGIFLILLAEISAQNRNLCDICECVPSSSDPVYVNCNCKKNKVLILKDEDGDVLANTKTLNISACNFVSFPNSGFPKSKKLKSVQIKQMKMFHLNSGIFPAVVNLAIEEINELIIDGFQGLTNLSNVEIKSSIVSELLEDSFKDLKNMEKLNFYDVSINTLAPNSLSFSSNASAKATVKFSNCRIDTIQPDSISLQVAKMEIINTSINMIHSNGLAVTATDSVDIIRSTFGPLISSDSFKFRSNKINIVDNEFKSLPSTLLKDVIVTNDKKINFMGNLIHDVDLGGFLLSSKLDKLNFVKNKIICDCTPRKTSILKLKDLFPGLLGNDPFFDGVIENNSCKNYNGIYLIEFKRKFLSGSLCNESDLKLYQTTYSSSDINELSSVSLQVSTETSLPSNAAFFSISLGRIVLSLVFLSFFANILYSV